MKSVTKHIITARMAAGEKTNSGLLYLMPDFLMKMCTLVALIFMWRAVMASGVQTGMSMAQMLSYAYISSLLGDMLVVQTPATGWLSEGVIQKLYGRPMPVLTQLAVQTCGGWVPGLIYYTLPMILLSPLLGVSLKPASPLFLISLLLCVSLGFAVDTLFACLSMKLRNATWLIGRLRLAIISLFSGTVIPIKLLPFNLADFMRYQPFASMGGAALTVFTGTADTGETLLLQVIWNLVVWPVSLWVFRKSQEGMVSYGG